jgi:hypothetical protein
MESTLLQCLICMLSEDLVLLSSDRRPLGKIDDIYGFTTSILNAVPIARGFWSIIINPLLQEVLRLITLENDPG